MIGRGPGFRRGRRRGLIVGAAMGSAAARRRNAADIDAMGAEDQVDPVQQLKELAELRDQGILTEEEFQAQKKQILG